MSSEGWDVFISHASEDKDDVVRPLDRKLRSLGLTTWVDEAEIALGDSLSRKIDDGLARSRAGIVILSPAFFSKKWPDYELRGLTARVMAGDGRILPVWHGVSHVEVTGFSPTLADAKAGNTQPSLDKLAMQIVSAVRPEIARAVLRKIAFETLASDAVPELREAKDFKQGPVRHPTLPSRLVNRIELVSHMLQEVHPQTLAEWLDGFQRDTHPTREIQIWEGIAARYGRAISNNDLTSHEKQKIFSALLFASMTAAEKAANIIVETFDDRSEGIVKSMMFDQGDFSMQTNDDVALMESIPHELELHEGPESQINLEYIEELVRSGRNK